MKRRRRDTGLPPPLSDICHPISDIFPAPNYHQFCSILMYLILFALLKT